MELKYASANASYLKQLGSNCTFMELKYTMVLFVLV